MARSSNRYGSANWYSDEQSTRLETIGWRKRVGVEIYGDSTTPVVSRPCSPHAPPNQYKQYNGLDGLANRGRFGETQKSGKPALLLTDKLCDKHQIILATSFRWRDNVLASGSSLGCGCG